MNKGEDNGKDKRNYQACVQRDSHFIFILQVRKVPHTGNLLYLMIVTTQLAAVLLAGNLYLLGKLSKSPNLIVLRRFHVKSP
ncbi:MAG: hypothetical protein COC23_05530 [Hyphomicrobiales bacterium]|nr:MAG: hypothetical protein COC23_05530 [Hyphomicrobiales bacterium]